MLEVTALRKAAHTRCAHQGEGCGVYPNRPEICRGFQCNWSMADPLLPEDARPDRAGVLVWVGQSPAGLTVFVHWLRAESAQNPAFRQAFDRWRAKLPVMEERADGTRALWLPGMDGVVL